MLLIEDTSMQREAFVSDLAKEGFPEPTMVTRKAGASEEHSHVFDARILVVEGEIRIRIGNDERTYTAGDSFHLPANVRHAECYGANGVQFLLSTK
jgi:quercetin dioxygenase-like cupin family protein